ncbi:hypothetical protein [Actinosynnema sp. NPDC023587]
MSFPATGPPAVPDAGGRLPEGRRALRPESGGPPVVVVLPDTGGAG